MKQHPPENAPDSSSSNPPPRDVGGYSPGRVGTVTVSVTGTVDAYDRDAATVTIAGRTYPLRLSDTVRHVSMLPPAETTVVGCDGDCDYDDGEADRLNRGWIDAVETNHHEERHPDAWRVCGHALCRRAREKGAR